MLQAFVSQILMGVSTKRIVNFLAEEMKREQAERERKERDLQQPKPRTMAVTAGR